jgi:hypothetical protein
MNIPDPFPDGYTMTADEDACLKMKAPISGNERLDFIIREGRKLDILQAVFVGLNEKPKNAEKSAHQSDEYLIAAMMASARYYAYDLFPQRQDPQS